MRERLEQFLLVVGMIVYIYSAYKALYDASANEFIVNIAISLNAAIGGAMMKYLGLGDKVKNGFRKLSFALGGVMIDRRVNENPPDMYMVLSGLYFALYCVVGLAAFVVHSREQAADTATAAQAIALSFLGIVAALIALRVNPQGRS